MGPRRFPGRSTKAADAFRAFVEDQLHGLDTIDCRAMFGGYGLYHEGGVFFGIIFKGQLYFKTDHASRSAYVTRGMGPFHPKPGITLKTYYEVPVEVLEDQEQVTSWARRAIACQRQGGRSPSS